MPAARPPSLPPKGGPWLVDFIDSNFVLVIKTFFGFLKYSFLFNLYNTCQG